jgi:UDP-N-acetylmuramoylalanine--D-glutamate ligase
MRKDARRFFEEMRGKAVAFMGIGVSNTGLIRQFAGYGARVVACDKRGKEDLGPVADELLALGVELRLGEGYLEGLKADIVFRTPGMSYNLKELRDLRERGVAVTSEMEVFVELCPCPIIAVTGSDGKTTTTTLIAEMLKAQGKTVHLGGNIGRALLPSVMEIAETDWAVVELSSFQLISMRTSPDIAVLTNITPNHLDIHANMEEYISAKRNIFAHQNAFSRTVLGCDNGLAASFAPEVRGELLFFSAKNRVGRGCWLNDDGMVMASANGHDEALFDSADIRLPGAHNVLNYLAAISATRGLVGAGAAHRVAKAFGGVEHRLELVREHRGIKWYNDSIATSPTRAIAGLRSFAGEKVILIAGGYDKNLSYEPIGAEIVRHVKKLILTGPTAAKIEAAVRAAQGYVGKPEIIRADNLEDAVQAARGLAASGDTVLLSPASASFDAFKNFEERGKYFKELVGSLR